MLIITAIPARYHSQRLPGKILADISGKPLIRHVYEAVRKSKNTEKIFVVTDNAKVFKEVESWGGACFMTDPALPSGTARIASVVDQLDAEYIVNVQGDMPLIQPDLLDDVILRLMEGIADIVTPVWPIKTAQQLSDPGTVKVVRSENGNALYFSRSPIPFVRDYKTEDWPQIHQFWGHYGIYGYQRHVLEDIAGGKLKTGKLEQAEKLEQLSFLEAGYTIGTVETLYDEIPVDTPEELEMVRKLMAEKIKNEE
ncbi:MAG: 3-deoxy-manno-octulosonate cytidylyltransferase [Calditrichaceae bacterium]|nr:3-deoxy-manno-octulosonate cytidylyltransferase [Calditrichaceae bacterium]MBN2708861.1 3-deoxy-manno-octulosonate cytidylyltransferase [Calditrichaceae bacterium]RQV97613.1 MAG: 3-deoxy-manno-octulosonate cytidylyltransferase [Calditrichota bacterium]